jgi:hypothetical protein
MPDMEDSDTYENEGFVMDGLNEEGQILYTVRRLMRFKKPRL